jgi:hypothetical protein
VILFISHITIYEGTKNEKGKWEMNEQVIGVWGISNNASLNIYKIEYGIDDQMLIGINDETPFWTPIIWNEEQGEQGIMYGEIFHAINDSMRV